jgi:catechol 2,3-dioxygenase-like lactoylglutathione lyase family enzyme
MALTRTATSYLALRVPDVAAARAFYTRVVGLRVHAELDGDGLRLGWGAGHHVLDLRPGEQALEHLAFEIAAPGLLDELAADLGAELRDMDGVRGIEVTDPDGNRIRLHDVIDRAGEQLGDGARRPIRYQHATLGTSDLEAMLAFYTGRLGFRLSDMMGDEFGWLRSSPDHHTLGIVRSGRRGLDHFSFDVSGWGDLLTWCDRLSAQGVDVTWGPGRHGPGNNLFIMFDDPAGNHVELSAEMEQFHDEHVEHPVRHWRPVPRSINLWGGQLAAFRTTSEGA